MIDHTTLRSNTYRDELASIVADIHDETGPQPTVQEIEAVLADLGAPGRGGDGRWVSSGS